MKDWTHVLNRLIHSQIQVTNFLVLECYTKRNIFQLSHGGKNPIFWSLYSFYVIIAWSSLNFDLYESDFMVVTLSLSLGFSYIRLCHNIC